MVPGSLGGVTAASYLPGELEEIHAATTAAVDRPEDPRLRRSAPRLRHGATAMRRPRRLDPGPQPVRQSLPERLRDAERRWWDPFVFAAVRPTTHGWTVYAVGDAGVRFPTTSVERRRSYGTLDEAMAAAERRNRLLRKREAEADAEWPLRNDPLPWA